MQQSWIASLLAVALVLGCAEAPPPPRGRVLVVGIDGASMRVIEPMIAAGRLPNLAALAREGASGKLRSLEPLLSPRVWTSVVTSRLPVDHGIENWVLPRGQAGSGQTRLYDSHDRRVHALWSILSAHGLRVATVNWLMTYPPEPVNGVMITDYAHPEEVRSKVELGQAFANASGRTLREPGALRAPTAWPEEWAARATDAKHAEPLIPNPDPFAPLAETELWSDLARANLIATRDQGLVSAALEVEAEIRPDLMLILLQGIDRVSHFAFGTLEDESTWDEAWLEPPEERLLARKALLDFYAYTDALIGVLVARYGPDDLVMVLSDHGFEAAEKFPLGRHENPEALDGVLFTRGRGVAAGSRTEPASVLDITPAILAWLGLPAGEDMEGSVPGFLAVSPVPPIASYDDEPVPRLARSASGEEEERLEQLRELGYIE